ncbi:MAG: glycoside hydrolase family 127 protein [Chloroflexi bacterium]|nr:glycoside hydrolase family 127 protein [Chloroflexota bacterium]
MASRLAAGPVDTTNSPHARLKTLPFDAVTIEGGIWAGRQEVVRTSALDHGYRMLVEAGNVENVRIAGGQSSASYRGPLYMDSDLYKWLEAAAYELVRAPTALLRRRMDEVIDAIAAAQQPDGYVNSYYTLVEPGKRWTNFAFGHELYCAGHLIQAAIAHHHATGEDRLLAIARRFADHIDAEFGPGRRAVTPGHPEIEMALVELYRATGERRYLTLSHVLVDNRGRGLLGSGPYFSGAYYQDRVPVRDTAEMEGHAVRALYLTAGITDLYLETGERALFEALERQWRDLVTRKLYLTGGAGSRHLAEAFGQPYELPNELGYCETCAAIAAVMWAWRMLLATGDARYADLAERCLYNAVLAGVSLDGERFFYVNPLASNGAPEYLHRGGPERQAWHSCACCPPNVMRLFASLQHYVATCDGAGLQIHQYVPGRIVAEIRDGRTIALRVATDYPWGGRVRITVEETDGGSWPLSLRVPGWCEAVSAWIDGQDVSRRVEAAGEAATEAEANGYLRIERTWRPGDVLEADCAMPARLIEAHPWIESTRGAVAIERGPLVYCLEGVDQPAPLRDLEIDLAAPLETSWRPDLLGGIMTVAASGSRVDTSSWQDRLYRPVAPGRRAARASARLTAIPYYAWAHRGPSPMRVWIPAATL